MAKKSAIENNDRRKRLVASRQASRDALKKIIHDREVDFGERMIAVRKLAEMPRNSSSVRIRNRCVLTGRSRGYYRKFGMSRIALRELASCGFLPGVVKASW
ncbi:MAG: 30S ribosomal protein S14 [Holosporales bacterium]|jgi:small subunit ribosomal protein S14|nr:30S ribosomal protein S14 [Holosporales bacterium]